MDSLKFIKENKEHITKSALAYDLPPEFLASVIYLEKTKETAINKFTDKLLSLLNLDPSIGDGQIKISTSAMLDGRDYNSLSKKEWQNYRENLTKTSSNIDYVAKYLNYIVNMPNRAMSISPEELINRPEVMAIVATEYNIGMRKSSLNEAKPNAYGFDVVAGLTDDSPLYNIFGRNSKPESKIIRSYLEHNRDLAAKALKNSEVEDKKRFEERLSYAITPFIALGGLYFILKKLKERRAENNLKC